MEVEMEMRMAALPMRDQKGEEMEVEGDGELEGESRAPIASAGCSHCSGGAQEIGCCALQPQPALPRMVVPPKRSHEAEDQVEGEAEAAKKRKIEPVAEEEEEYDPNWDDSWWECVDSGDEDSELLKDCNAFQARLFRESWDSDSYGPFEAETKIPSMRFTDSEDGYVESTLQIFAVKVIAIRGGLQWPIDVYGCVAIRDSLDRNRNTIFYRERDSCQTLTQQDSSLVLTGPVRAVRVIDPPIFEADLKVKGNAESEDKMLSFLAAPFVCCNGRTYLIKTDYISKLSKMEFTLGYISRSVEATINMRVTDGTCLDSFHGKFVARTASINDEQVVLLSSGDKKVHLDGNDILLSRSVVSVDLHGELIVSVEVWKGVHEKADLKKVEKSFTAFEMSRSRGEIDVGFCKIEVIVAWSCY